MCRTPAVTRPVRYGQVRGNGVCVESIGKIEKTKNKNFQNFSISRCWSACGTHFTLLNFFLKIVSMQPPIFRYAECLWDPMGRHGLSRSRPYRPKNECKTHQKMTPACPFALPTHENCRFHRMQKSIKSTTATKRVFFDFRSANGIPQVDSTAQK